VFLLLDGLLSARLGFIHLQWALFGGADRCRVKPGIRKRSDSAMPAPDWQNRSGSC